MHTFYVRNALLYLFLSCMLVNVIKAVQEGQQQNTNTPSSAGHHRSVIGASASTSAVPLERVHLASQSRFIRIPTSHGESRYFGASEAEEHSNARNRVNSISRQRKGWKSTPENLANRYQYLKDRKEQRQTKDAALAHPHQGQVQVRDDRSKSRFTAEDHVMQSKSHLSQPVRKPIARKVSKTAVIIDHPDAVRQHKITQSPTSAFHKVHPTTNGASRDAAAPPRSSPNHSSSATSHESTNPQGELMSKHFGGWKTPSRKRKHE
ncbi:uncharacterized protein FA14DRAFT_181689 [Meira miltonrushii]|uniref:Secreted protein n=1 Tax=Meira miltonrushii TaxID=1280837 RepID=A0A316VBU2_9BASI|nr:uncharacterized protein FA14DRAFT_181689 [Meira miltonrushii]PWN33025.1 hypothetical protein FA14DRAFT_181689 [Meira miltonrushii]